MPNTQTPRDWHGHVAVLFASIPMCVLVIASVGTLISFGATVSSFRQWYIIPNAQAHLVVGVVYATELFVGLCWLVDIGRLACVRIAVLLLAALTGAYVVESVLHGAPDCNCFGVLLKYERLMDGIYAVLVRNTVLVTLLVVSIALRNNQRKKSPGDTTQSDQMQRRQRTRRASPGFTLIEAIVVMGIVGVVITIGLISARSVRKQARTMTKLNGARQHVATFTAYAGDWKDTLPFVFPTDAETVPSMVIWPPDKPNFRHRLSSHWEFSLIWNWVLAKPEYGGYVDRYMGNEYQAFLDVGHWAGLRYSFSFLSRPEFWNSSQRTGPDQWKSVRLTEVRTPHSKAMFYENWSYNGESGAFETAFRQRPIAIGFADGSARVVMPREMKLGYPTGIGQWMKYGYPYLAHGNGFDPPVAVTLDGVRGRDIID